VVVDLEIAWKKAQQRHLTERLTNYLTKVSVVENVSSSLYRLSVPALNEMYLI
jgi:hypothetical protein